MAGYAASSRLHGAVPRFAGAIPDMDDGLPCGDDPEAFDRVELVGRPLDEAIREWLASIGESWSQLTFYLFDPESWR